MRSASIFPCMMEMIFNFTIFLIFFIFIFKFFFANKTYFWFSYISCSSFVNNFVFFFAKLSLYRAILRIFIELFHANFTSVYIMLMFYAFKWRNCRHWNPDEICLPTFVVDEFSGLFLHPPIFLLNIQDLHQ